MSRNYNTIHAKYGGVTAIDHRLDEEEAR